MTIVDPMPGPAAPTVARLAPMNSRGPRALSRRQRLVEAATPRPQVCVVDTSAILRAGLPLVLTTFEFPGLYATAGALLVSHPAAGLVLFEPDTQAGPDIDGVRSLVRAGFTVCIYTRDSRRTVAARCIAAGARGLVSKSEPLGALTSALRRLAAGGTAISPQFAGTRAVAPSDELTERQLQILAGRARGETFLSIARRLEISERTAQDHWSSLARRFDGFLKTHSPADLERSLGLDAGVAPLDEQRRTLR